MENHLGQSDYCLMTTFCVQKSGTLIHLFWIFCSNGFLDFLRTQVSAEIDVCLEVYLWKLVFFLCLCGDSHPIFSPWIILISFEREEADELCRTLEENEDIAQTASEMADVIYHAMVLLAKRGVKVKDVMQVLRQRFRQSGIEEKESRKA